MGFLMRYLFLLFFCATAAADPQLVSVKKISDSAPHSAFTDLAYFKDHWFCTFREGAAHVSWADDPATVFASIRQFLRGEWPLAASR